MGGWWGEGVEKNGDTRKRRVKCWRGGGALPEEFDVLGHGDHM